MKRILYLFIFLLSVSRIFAQNEFTDFQDREKSRHVRVVDRDYHFEYQAIRDTKSLKFRNRAYSAYDIDIPIKKGELVKVWYDLDVARSILDFDKYGFIVEPQNYDDRLIVPMKDFGLPGKQRLPATIANNEWCLKYHYDVLKSKNRDTLSEYEWWINIYDEKLSSFFERDPDGFLTYYNWYEVYKYSPGILITDSCVTFDGFFYTYGAKGFVRDVYDNKIKVLWAQASYPRCFIDAFDSMKTSYESILEYELDGDFLKLKIDGSEIVLAKKSQDFDNQWTSLIQNNTCNLTKIIWPRHADGSCDYETAVRLQSGKRYRASDNLRLRSSGSTAGKPVVTIGKGTQVKVLGIGAEQTIDGITSNWVQVEVQSGAKDRDGNPIAAGTTGWVFGGYLE